MNDLINSSKMLGFTVIELIIVIAILAILAAVVYPSFSTLMPDHRVRGDVSKLEMLMKKARQKAAAGQKPIRVSINCTRTAGDYCYASMQSAIFDKGEVIGWNPGTPDGFKLNSKVKVGQISGLKASDADTNLDKLYWIIFLPDSHTLSGPKPFEIFAYYDSSSVNPRSGYRLSVSHETARVSYKKDTLNVI
jgi:prepilin-type N-terminal cleavage/methylation domain-containing protein